MILTGNLGYSGIGKAVCGQRRVWQRLGNRDVINIGVKNRGQVRPVGGQRLFRRAGYCRTDGNDEILPESETAILQRSRDQLLQWQYALDRRYRKSTFP